MSEFRQVARTVLAKVETTAGTDASPVVGTDAVKMVAPRVAPQIAQLSSNEVTRALDLARRIPGGAIGQFTGGVVMKGSGSAGTAPEQGTLLRGCAMAETLLASDTTGTCQAGSTTTTAVLAAGAVTSNDQYIGMVIETTGGTGSGQTRVITDSVASTDTVTVTPAWTTTPDATTTYAIRACAVYAPASSSLENLTIYNYVHKSTAGNHLLEKVLGAMGDFTISGTLRDLVRVEFTFSGKFVKTADVADPGSATYDAVDGIAFQGADFYLGDSAIKPRAFSIAGGNGVVQADDPADTYGVDVGSVVTRQISGRINPPRTNIATRDVLTDLLAGTQRALWLRWGTTAGKRVSILLPTITYTGAEDEDVDGFANEGIPFDAGGEDTGLYICYY